MTGPGQGCLEKRWKLKLQRERIAAFERCVIAWHLRRIRRGGIVKRNALILGIAIFALAGALLAQDPPDKTSAKKAASHGAAGSATRGKEVFEKKCAICHFADSDAKKIGPGLKGISKRGTFTVNGKKVTSESLRTWIENGDSLMPGMKETLEPAQIKDVVAYFKTL